MQRRPTTQDISWILDLERNKQLNLNPPYQRKSVWTRKDKQFFLDTIFRNYPSPAIFLHKSISDTGQTLYHVVDGKQRLTTIFEFINDKLRMPTTYGDVRIDGKKWSDFQGDPELKKALWNYQITVEIIDFDDANLINQVFDRLNRNARKLTDQELRHSKFDGWFIGEVESEIERADWRELGVVTNARTRRMADAQFMSELMLVVIRGELLGFDQSVLDDYYGKYDDLEEIEEPIDPEDVQAKLGRARAKLTAMEATNGSVSAAAKALFHIYTLWGVLVIHEQDLPDVAELATRYEEFMRLVEAASRAQDVNAWVAEGADGKRALAFRYWNATRGANTELRQRTERLEALWSFLSA